MADKIEPNVTKTGNTIRVNRSFVKSVTADLVKREIKLTMTITLDESSFAVRGDMALWAFEASPVALTLRPLQMQLGLQGLTLEPDERAVAETMSGDGDDEDS